MSAQDDSKSQNQIQIHLTEYQKLRDEFLQHQNAMNQSIVLALGSASLAIPLLVGQSGQVPKILLIEVLFVLTIIYSVISMNFASAGFYIGILTKYMHLYLEPELNRLTKTTESHRVLSWESFFREERHNPVAVVLASISAWGNALILLLPGGIALLAANYLSSLPDSVPPQQVLLTGLVSAIQTPLAILSWITYLIAVLIMILTPIYQVLRTKWF